MKRILSILLSLALIVGCIMVPVSATETVPTITVETKAESVAPGETFTLDVALTNNPGVDSFDWTIWYEESQLALTDIACQVVATVNSDTNKVVYGGATTVTGDYPKLVTLTFTVKETAANGFAQVNIEVVEFASVNGDISHNVHFGGVTIDNGEEDTTGGTTSGDNTTGGSTTGGTTTGGTTTGGTTTGGTTTGGTTTGGTTTGGTTTGGTTTGGTTTGGTTTGGTTTGGTTTGGTTTGGTTTGGTTTGGGNTGDGEEGGDTGCDHKYEWTVEANEHWRGCTVCGEEEANSRGQHTGGKATCQGQAVCEVCNVTYGPEAPNAHEYELIQASPANCTEPGWIAHQKCVHHDDALLNAEGTASVTKEDITIPAGHKLDKVDAVDPTTSSSGNTEHYKCSVCGKLFADADAKKEVSEQDVFIPASPVQPDVPGDDTEYEAWKLGETKTMTLLPQHAAVQYSFVPEADGVYYFVQPIVETGLSYGFVDILDGGYPLTEAVRGHHNVSYVGYELKAGKEYIVGVGLYGNFETAQTATVTLSATKPSAEAMVLDATYTLTLNPQKYVYYSFTPVVSGEYYFIQPMVQNGTIPAFPSVTTAENGNYVQSAGINYNTNEFWYIFNFEAGTEYQIGISMSPSYETAQTVPIKLTATEPEASQPVGPSGPTVPEDIEEIKLEETKSLTMGPDDFVYYSFTPAKDGTYYLATEVGEHGLGYAFYAIWKADDRADHVEWSTWGSISKDWYGFELKGGVEYVIRVGLLGNHETTQSFNLTLTATCPDVATPIALNVANSVSLNPSGNAIFSFTPAKDGTYYLLNHFDENGQTGFAASLYTDYFFYEREYVEPLSYKYSNQYVWDIYELKAGVEYTIELWGYADNTSAVTATFTMADVEPEGAITPPEYVESGIFKVEETKTLTLEPNTVYWYTVEHEKGGSHYIGVPLANNETSVFWGIADLTEGQPEFGGSIIGDGIIWIEIVLEADHEYELMFQLNDEIYETAQTFSVSLTANKPIGRTGWFKSGDVWFYLIDGEPTTGWVEDGGKWYYMGEYGIMQTGWVEDGGKWYYLNDDGSMATNCWKQDSTGWCYLGGDGAMLTNAWVEDGNGWCYVGADGYCVTGTVEIDGVEYTFDENGNWIEDAENEEPEQPEEPEVPEEEPVVTTGWVYEDGNWYYYDAAGNMVTNAWVQDSIGWCYLSSNGAMATNAWILDSNGWCYVGADGYCVTGTVEINGVEYTFDENGNLIEDVETEEPEQPEEPEVPEEEPVVVTGWVYEDGNWYYYDAAGNMVTNAWVQDSIGWCYLGNDGAMITNTWIEDSNGWCYIGADGYCVTGTVEIDGVEYTFDENGNWIEDAETEEPEQPEEPEAPEVPEVPEEEPVVVTGWVYEDGNWYYYDAAGNKVTNAWMQDSIGWCYLGNDGAMITNTWIEDSNGWCYIGADGYCVTGTVEIDGVEYTFDENGNWIEDAETEEPEQPEEPEAPEVPEVPEEEPVVVTGWVYEDGNWYYYDAAGNMVTNAWMLDSIGWCYLGNDGAMVTNTWIEDSNGWCYIGADGYCVTGTVEIDGVEYTFDENGNWIEDAETEEPEQPEEPEAPEAPEEPEVPEEEPVVTTGWVYEDGNWYYYNAAGNKQVGWLYWNGEWYYLNADGSMATGWIKWYGEWYYLEDDGVMATGWVEDDNVWYYLEDDGIMVTGTHEVDGVTYVFADSGAWIG